LIRVSSTDLTRVETLPSGYTYFLILLSGNDNDFDKFIIIIAK